MLHKARSIAVVCVMTAACSVQSPTGASPTATTPPAVQPTAAPTAAATAAPTQPAATPWPTLPARFAPGGTAPAGAIAVDLGSCCALTFVPYKLEAKAGTVELFLTNPTNKANPYKHDMHIGKVQDQALASSPVLKNSETGLFTIEGLAAGDYVFWCEVDAHDTRGMVGTLTVTP